MLGFLLVNITQVASDLLPLSATDRGFNALFLIVWGFGWADVFTAIWNDYGEMKSGKPLHPHNIFNHQEEPEIYKLYPVKRRSRFPLVALMVMTVFTLLVFR